MQRRVAAYCVLSSTVLAGGMMSNAQAIHANGDVSVPAFSLPYSSIASSKAKEQFIKKVQAPLPSTHEIAGLRDFYGAYNNRLAARMREAYPVSLRRETWNGVHVIRVRPREGVSEAKRNKVLLNLHGGAFMWGNGSGEEVEAIPIAAQAGMEVVSVDYRLAPEHTYPSALEDIATVYRRLLKTYRPENIGVYGCSAGGILASESIARFVKENLPMPGALGTFCGAAFAFDGDSTYTAPPSVNEPPREGRGSTMLANAYFRGTDPKSPLVFPAISNDVMKHFPPTLLLSGTRDQALSSCMASELALRRVGVKTEMHIWDGMWHAFFVDPDIPESHEAYVFIAKFFEKNLGRSHEKETR